MSIFYYLFIRFRKAAEAWEIKFRRLNKDTPQVKWRNHRLLSENIRTRGGLLPCELFPGSPHAIKAVEATVDHMPEPDGNFRSLKTLCVLAVGHGGLGGDWAARKLLFWPVSQCQGPPHGLLEDSWHSACSLVLVSHKLMSKAEGSYFVPHL